MKSLFLLVLAFSLCATSLHAAPTSKPAPFKAWDFPQKALFFKQQADEDWFARPETEREWLTPERLSPDVFKALDMTNTELAFRRGAFERITSPDALKTQREAALATWRTAVRPEWVPSPEIIVPGRMHLNSSDDSKPSHFYEIAYCPFERGNVRGLYMTRPGLEFWLYLEQPYPLPKGTMPLRHADVLRAVAFPSVSGKELKAVPSLLAREFVRYRAPLTTGPYQQVRILLLHVQLPSSLEVATFGYRGGITP